MRLTAPTCIIAAFVCAIVALSSPAVSEASPGLGAGHQQRVEHPAAVLLMVGQAAEEQGRALATGRDIKGAGGLGSFRSHQVGSRDVHRKQRSGPL